MEHDKDMEIARLKGQIDAFEKQLHSTAIELLRYQMNELVSDNTANKGAIHSLQRELASFKAEMRQRLTKATTAFTRLRDQIEELKDAQSKNAKSP